MAVTYVDPLGPFQEWVNAQADLVGEGNPLPKGATLRRQRGATPAAYVWISQVGGVHAGSAESPDLQARIGGQVFGATEEATARAAAAYAEVVSTRLSGAQTVSGDARLLVVAGITGPSWAPDRDEPRYLVDVELILRPT